MQLPFFVMDTFGEAQGPNNTRNLIRLKSIHSKLKSIVTLASDKQSDSLSDIHGNSLCEKSVHSNQFDDQRFHSQADQNPCQSNLVRR